MLSRSSESSTEGLDVENWEGRGLLLVVRAESPAGVIVRAGSVCPSFIHHRNCAARASARDTVSHPVSSETSDAKDTATAGPSPRGKTPQREPTDGARLPVR